MSYFAKVINGIVVEVIVADQDFIDSGAVGDPSVWVETEHSSSGIPLRKNFAGIGYIYDSKLDAFIPPQPYPSWVLDIETGQWCSVVSKPNNKRPYVWNENQKIWVEVTQ
jgi:hypothetical protein